MEGECHLGPVSWPVRHLRAELRAWLPARDAARACRGRRRGGGRSRMIAAGRLAGLARASAASQPGSDGGRTDEQEKIPPLDRHPDTLPRIRRGGDSARNRYRGRGKPVRAERNCHPPRGVQGWRKGGLLWALAESWA